MPISFDDLELGWAAGFYDGEGCASVHVERRKGRKPRIEFSLQVSQSQRQLDSLDRFQFAVGGGRIYGPYERHQGMYWWKAQGQDALRIAELLKPYISAYKRIQIERCRSMKETGQMALNLDAAGAT